MKYLILLHFFFNWSTLFSQALVSEPIIGCVGDTIKYYFEFDTTKIRSIDSMRWQFHLNGWVTNIEEIDTVVGIPFYYVFTDTFLDWSVNGGVKSFPYADIIWYGTDIDGFHGSSPAFASFGGVPDCEIRYAKFKSDRQKICNNECVNFSDASDRYPRLHKWYFEGASPPYSEERNPRNICYASPGKYTVKHIVSNSVDSDSIMVADYIEVLPSPDLIQDSVIYQEGFWGDTIKLNACAETAFYKWTPEVPQLSCSDCPNPSLILGGQTQFTLEAWNNTACIQRCTHQLKVNKRESLVYIPNVFSPNGDKNNDEFEIFGIFYELRKMEIYNRWGELLFQSDSPTAKWTGLSKGSIVPSGVYLYRIIYTDTNLMEEKTATGTITVVNGRMN